MKLAALAFLTTLGLGSVAGADPAGPGNPPPIGPRAAVPVPPPAPAPGPVARRADRPHGQLRQAVMAQFDRNHDGQLDPAERRHAIHALRRMARRMEVQERRDERGERSATRRDERLRELVRRYDRNGDGVVGPDEMPPGVARRLQRLDRNGDGWIDERDR